MRSITQLTLSNSSFILGSCRSITSDIFRYFDDQSLSNIEYLDLGLTNVNEEFSKYIPKMNKLLYLNIDELQITGQNLVYYFKEAQFKNKVNRLKHLSLKKSHRGNFIEAGGKVSVD